MIRGLFTDKACYDGIQNFPRCSILAVYEDCNSEVLLRIKSDRVLLTDGAARVRDFARSRVRESKYF